MRADEPRRPDTHRPTDGTLRPGALHADSPGQPVPSSEVSWGTRPESLPTAVLAPPQLEGELGRIGGYRVLKILGQGGMGVVFLAEDPGLHRKVAIKCMLPEVATRSDNRERFLREARLTAAVEHENIIPIYLVSEDRGVPFLVMPWLRGETVGDRLKRDKRLPILEAIRIAREMACGLAAAHEHGLIHRDVKPSNVWLEASTGRVKILDFGLARAEGVDGTSVQGQVLGTPGYMAPEQATGGQLDHRADLFSLGCMLYEMTTGQQPFEGPDILATLAKLADRTPPTSPRQLNPEIPLELSNLIDSLVEKEPARRPASAAAVVDALDRISHVASGSMPPRPAGPLLVSPYPPVGPTGTGPASLNWPPSSGPVETKAEDVTTLPSPSRFSPDLAPPAQEIATPTPPPRRQNHLLVIAVAGVTAVVLMIGGIVLLGLLSGPTRPTEQTTPATSAGNGTQPTHGITLPTSRPGPGVTVHEDPTLGGTVRLMQADDPGASLVAGVKPPPPGGFTISAGKTEEPAGDADYQRAVSALTGDGAPLDPKLAAALFQTAASKGHAAAGYWYAQLRLYGYNAVRIDRKDGLSWLQKAADQGYPPAQADLAHLLVRGLDVPQDVTTAIVLFGSARPGLEKLAADGDRDGAYGLGLLRLWGVGELKDYADALKWLGQARRAGHPAAALRLATLYEAGWGTDKDEAEAYRLLKESAERGNAAAQLAMARAHARGQGVPLDHCVALTWVRKAEGQAYPDAMTELGLIHSQGRCVRRDEREAVKYYEAAARAGHADGMFRLGRARFYGLGTKVDIADGVDWYRKATDLRHPLATCTLGLLESEGWGLTKNLEKGSERVRIARPEVERLATTDDPTIGYILGEVYYHGRGNEAADEDRAMEWYQKGVALGDPVAMNRLASYLRGKARKDPIEEPRLQAEALRLTRAAAEAELPHALFQLGELYRSGSGVKQDSEQAESWYRRAAEAGLAQAQVALALLIQRERPAESTQWFQRAVSAYTRAAEHGDQYSQYALGQLHERGLGITRNYSEAARWYELAARQGHPQAQLSLGRLYEQGEGVEPNLDTAVKWYEAAARQGLADAQKALKRLRGN